ncbi:MAG: hypothetical protein N4A53_02535 [Pelagimonas sp.]|jgi:hypothetical protein|nr:hypothetical protein [Pelagimonas sp.]
MKRFSLFSLLAVSLLWGCGVGDTRTVVNVGGEEVQYRPISVDQGTSSDGLTTLLFTFGAIDPTANYNGVTDADYEREAKRLGFTVQFLKHYHYGGNPYLGPKGDLRTCTILAQRKGLCRGPNKVKSLNDRIALAKQALEQDDKCRWTGFNPSFHHVMAYRAGAEEHTLWVKADC